jgi:uncharacterized damage-inducible protein DinB
MIDPSALTTTLARNLSLLESQADGVSHEASMRPIVPGGSTFNWLLGHVALSRDRMLDALRAETRLDAAASAHYARGGTAPGADEAERFENLLATLAEQQARLEAALGGADADLLARPVMEGRSDVGSWVDFLVWHETYHVGQAVLYRRLAGLPSAIG